MPNIKNLLEKRICYKSLTNPSCVDLIVTNRSRSFQSSCTSKLGSLTSRKFGTFAKPKPRVLNYCNYKFFNSALFRDQVLNKLRNSNLQISDKDLKRFKETFLSIVNTIAPLKSRFRQANQAPFINNGIQRVRSNLRKRFLKRRSESDTKAYNKQKNKCVSLPRKPKKHTGRF